MRLRLPPKVSYIIGELERRGYEAYAVGGCVRDMVLGRTPPDYDITTSASPREVKACFRRTADTGIKHGTVTVMLGDDGFEVTTYRVDGAYSDGRHPDSVRFTPDLTEDLARRDFTMNAMAYNDARGLVDPFGGMLDLQKKLIRCVGDPSLRFGEDALRMMRAVRFSAQLGFKVDEDTALAIRRHSAELSRVSAERIRDELMKLLISGEPGLVSDMYRLGITAMILPELDALMDEPSGDEEMGEGDSAGEHVIRTVKAISPDAVLRLAALLSGCSAAAADAALVRLKFDNYTRKKVVNLIANFRRRPDTSAPSVRRAMRDAGPDEFEDLLALIWADSLASGEEASKEILPWLNNIYARCDQIRRMGDPLDRKDLAVNGSDLMELGFAGKEVGAVLDDLMEAVLDDPSRNDREILMNMASLKKEVREDQ